MDKFLLYHTSLITSLIMKLMKLLIQRTPIFKFSNFNVSIFSPKFILQMYTHNNNNEQFLYYRIFRKLPELNGSHIWNCDETGFSTNASTGKVIIIKVH